jgi:shikimate kinase/3-dehydroquinate synthase
MGAGKSSVGKALAARLGRPFFDLDEEIARAAGERPGEIISRRGEPAFRDLEGEVLRRVALSDGRIVALGGGTLERPENLDLVRQRGALVYLQAAPEVLLQRTAADGLASRPLLSGDALARMNDLLARREDTYRRADLTVSTEGRNVDEVAAVIAGEGVDLERIDVAAPGGHYPIFFASDERGRLGGLVAARHGGARAALVVDSAIDARYGPEAEASLRAGGLDPHRIAVPAGEGSKSMEGLSRLYDALLGAGLDRGSPVVALGGGVVGDLAGFAAATLFRGVPLVQVPTTLLAQVDSSVGGKTGINHPAGKNLIGAFHQPSLVFADTSYLASLPARDLRAGLAEVVKYGVIADADLFASLERNAGQLLAGDPEALRGAVRRCCEIKAAVVAADERETSGARAVLNFGHTFGHALERLTGYEEMRHGEAVAVGMVVAARLSALLGLCDATVPDRIAGLLARLGLPTTHAFSPEAIVDAARTDKKVRSGAIHLLLVEAVGRVRRVPFAPSDLAKHLRGLS